MGGLFDYLAAGGVDHTLLAAQQGEYSVMNLAVDLGTSQQGGGGVISQIVHWVFTILAAISGLGFFWKAATEWSGDTKKALMFFGGGVLMSALFLMLPKILGVTENIVPF